MVIVSNDRRGKFSVNLNTLATLIGVVIPLWGAIFYGVSFYNDIMRKSEFENHFVVRSAHSHEHLVDKIDATIERTQILVAVYSLHSGTLTESERNAYEQARARIIQLQEQRDRFVGPQ